MKSFIGPKKAVTDNGTPYVVYAIGVKPEGEKVSIIGREPDILWNLFFNELLTQIENNKDKNIVWRRFPEISEETMIVELEPGDKLPCSVSDCKITNNKFYRITARYCFE